jgi:hypothetical protein
VREIHLLLAIINGLCCRAISERRNVLLREMHRMIRRRNDLGSILTSDNEDEEDLQVFLQRFTMTRDKYATVFLAVPFCIFTACEAPRQVA